MEEQREFERIDLGVEGLHIGDFVIGSLLWVGRFIGRQTAHLQHEGISDHFRQEPRPVAPETTRMAQIALNFDSEGREVE